jgi:Uma2 family endonuclease
VQWTEVRVHCTNLNGPLERGVGPGTWRLCSLRGRHADAMTQRSAGNHDLSKFGRTGGAWSGRIVIPPLHTDGMAPMTTALLSADEYLATAETRPRWTQLINGQVHVNAPGFDHQYATAALNAHLFHWSTSTGKGRAPCSLDIRLDDGTVLAPDGLWASDISVGTIFLATPPELVFEVRSPSTWKYDIGTKLQKYQAFGVAEVWLVDTESHSVQVHRRGTPQSATFDVALELFGGETLNSPLLPGFAVAISAIFAE